MWAALRDRQLGGFKFVREYPMGPFFVDFCCRSAKVVVEIDGGTHSTAEELAHDRIREAYLQAQGFRVFRVSNGEVCDNLDGVCDTLLALVRSERD